MKILYGVQGTGNGHISRVRAMAKCFAEAGVQVDYLFTGREKEQFTEMEEFGDWRYMRGLSLKISNGKLLPLQTLLSVRPIQLLQDIHQNLDVSGYDLIISDFEPVSAWAARVQGKPCLGLSRQCAFDYQIPKAGETFASRMIMKWFAPANYRLGLHWYHFNQPILPPIINRDYLKQTVQSDPKKVVVYLPFENQLEVIQVLQQLPDYDFYYYGDVDAPEQYGNVRLFPISKAFQKDLVTCMGVVAHAGFELSSEAISLGKCLLVKPLEGQMEQASNGLALEQLHLGVVMQHLTVEEIAKWLALSTIRKVIYPDVAKAVVDWILKGDLTNSSHLVEDLWRQTSAYGADSTFYSAKASADELIKSA